MFDLSDARTNDQSSHNVPGGVFYGIFTSSFPLHNSTLEILKQLTRPVEQSLVIVEIMKSWEETALMCGPQLLSDYSLPEELYGR